MPLPASRTTVISYGSFSSNQSYFYLNGAHSIDLDERKFRIEFDVVCAAPSAALLVVAVNAMQTALNERHQTLTVTIDGETLYEFIDGVDSTPTGVQEGAEFIIADWELLGSHRSSVSRAYRITVDVTRAANQPSKAGVYEQSINVSTNPIGIRRLNFRAQFTPGADSSPSGNADTISQNATTGFDKLVSDIQTVLGGTWERQGSLSESYDEDKRTKTMSASYRELIYDQSARGTNDAALVGCTYDIRVERKPGLSIPGRSNAKQLTPVTVLFTSGVLKSETQDLSATIDDVVLPYVRATVANALRVGGGSGLIYLGHGLRCNPMENRIAGQVLFIAVESNTIEVSKRIADKARTGDTYIPVLDGTRWTRDKHTGPGLWNRFVVFSCRVVGTNAGSVLNPLEEAEIADQKAKGFMFTGWSVNSSPRLETFSTETGGGTLTTTIQTLALDFERANVRGFSSSGTALNRRRSTLDNDPGSGTGAGPSGFQDRT